MAIEEVNAAGGLLGKQVRVIVEDDQGHTLYFGQPLQARH